MCQGVDKKHCKELILDKLADIVYENSKLSFIPNNIVVHDPKEMYKPVFPFGPRYPSNNVVFDASWGPIRPHSFPELFRDRIH